MVYLKRAMLVFPAALSSKSRLMHDHLFNKSKRSSQQLLKQYSNCSSHHNYIPKLHCCTSTGASSKIEEVMPKHIGVILDGNGRWAQNRGLPVEDGHRAGLDALTKLVYNCNHFGIKVLTVFAFSIDNWKRSQKEVEIVMRYIADFIQSEVMELIQRQDIRFSVIGNKSQLPESLKATISSAEEAGRVNGGMHFVMAVNYSGRNEITRVCKKMAMLVEEGVLKAKEIDENIVEQKMMTSFLDFSDVDLLIRTSGELRVSNFMLWQLAYAELYFAKKMFPDFGKDDLVEALSSFQQRKRRYGERKS